MVRRSIPICTGLGKSHLFRRKGLVAFYYELKEIVGKDTQVGLYAWDGYDEILKDFQRWKPDEIFPIGHSYGGSTSNFFCQALTGFTNVRIPHAVYADPVWRNEIYRIAKESLDSTKVITVPNNVERVSTFRQERGPITGHKLKVGPNTEWFDEVVTERRHAFMDRLPAFRERALAVLGLKGHA